MLTNETSLWSVSCHCGCDRDLIVWIIPESKPVQGFPPASMNFDHLRLDCYKTKNWDLKLSFKMRHNCCHWLVLFDRDSYIIISSHQITTNLFSCKCQKVWCPFPHCTSNVFACPLLPLLIFWRASGAFPQVRILYALLFLFFKEIKF